MILKLENRPTSLLDTQISRLTRWLLPIVWFILPAAMVILQFKPATTFTQVISFGENFNAAVIPELNGVQRYVSPGAGYDGQFYVQLAVDPALRDPQLKHALDLPTYRARRIFLPALSYLLGLGIPGIVVQVYAVINLLFWALLLAGLLYFMKPGTLKEYLVIMAIVWSSGSLISVARALIDLPAAVLALVAAYLQTVGSLPLFVAAIFCKETSILSFACIVWPFPLTWKKVGKACLFMAVIVLPFAAWLLYVNHQLGSSQFLGSGNFESPFKALFRQLALAWSNLGQAVNILTIFDFLAPISLLIQAVYLFVRPKFGSPIWRMGIGFAVMFFIMGSSVWVQQMNYTRSVLPMTIAFNLLLIRPGEKHFGWWFVPGNLGLAWAIVTLL